MDFKKFKARRKVEFLQWTPLFALMFGGLNIILLTVGMTVAKQDFTYAVMGGIALCVIGAFLYQVRAGLPAIFGIKNDT